MSTVNCIRCLLKMENVRSDKKYCSECFKIHNREMHRIADRTDAARLRYARYRNTEKYRKYSRDRYKSMPEEKRKARYYVSNAVRDGRVKRPDKCDNCGILDWGIKRSQIEAHHYAGYDQKNWLLIKWLCTRCHKMADGKGGGSLCGMS